MQVLAVGSQSYAQEHWYNWEQCLLHKPVGLSIGMYGVLKSPTITELLLISPFTVVSICYV